MNYNVAINSFVSTNTTSGNVSLTVDQLRTILKPELTSSVTLSGSNILCLDIDLGMRLKIDEIQYYFTSTSSSGTVASGIKFYYKDDDPDTYTRLSTNSIGGYYYTTISGLSAPRYVRIVHTVSGTSVSGVLNKVQVTNDDTIVNFGDVGTQNLVNFEMDLVEDSEDIKEVKVFNSGPRDANAYVFQEYTNSVVDTLFSISKYPTGPWYSIKNTEDFIVGAPYWTTRSFCTNLASRQAQTGLSLISGVTSGTCTTTVFGVDEDQKLSSLIIDREYPLVASGVIFSDDFSAGGGNWQTLEGTSSYSSGYLQNAGNNCSVKTVNTFNYGHDWILYAEIRNDNWSNNYQPGMTFVALGAATGYIHLEFNKYNTTISLNINGTGRGSITLSPSGYSNWQGYWISIIVQRLFNTVRYKVWRRGTDTEPTSWTYSTTVIYSDVADYGYIQLWDDWGTTYMDNVRIETNRSSNGLTRGMLSVNASDTSETIEVRSSNAKPKDVELYYENYNSYPTNLRRKWLETDAIEASDICGGLNGGVYHMEVDSKNENVYILKSGYYGYETILSIAFGAGTISSTGSLSGEDPRNGWSVQRVCPTSEEGFWISYYIANGTQYILRYIDKTLTGKFYRKEVVTFITDMCVEYYNKYLWYIDRTSEMLLKMYTDGTISSQAYDLTGLNPKSITMSHDSAYMWVLVDNYILKIDTNANLVGSIAMDTSLIAVIRNDVNDDGLWITEEETKITKIDYSGNRIFTVSVPAAPKRLVPLVTGIIVHDINNKYHYISSVTQTLLRNSFYSSSMNIGFLSYKFDDMGTYRKSIRVPVPNDLTWSNLTWNKVSLDDYTMNKGLYRQVRITLRANNSNESPILGSIYKQTAIKLEDIEKGYSKSFYLKSDVSSLTTSGVGEYNSHIKVWWYLPV